ncbi:sulfotransferase family protein [Ornithinimicrobium cavernae]|uniref:sulfotransferase family protein n=1 Tax=Ornithinimicrobium cavernae TaxID=2666047 RepID=UPI000D68DF2A|nr:sulfotransferase family protein [Ornithinimicrobium cavernae]
MPYVNEQQIAVHKKILDFHNNTNISLVNGYVYYAIDKVANSSIKNALFHIEYGKVKKEPLSLYDERCSPLLSPYQLPTDMLKNALNSGNYFRFAFVRNPYSRLLSCYLDRILTATSRPRRQLNISLKAQGLGTGEVSFETFIRTICEQTSPQQNSHWRVQADDVAHPVLELDYIGKFESLWDDMRTLSKEIWGEVRPEMAIEGVNKSPKATNASDRLKQYYTPELAGLVAERYSADFELFGYETKM